MRGVLFSFGILSVAVALSFGSDRISGISQGDRGTAAAQAPACLGFDGAVNTPEASLVVNYNSEGAFPLTVMMGELDPNLVVVDGDPGADYRVRLIGCGRTQAYKQLFASGTLDVDGRGGIMLSPGDVEAGQVFMLQASVADASMPTGYRLSGATQVTVVPTMSSAIDLFMPQGIFADARGPVMDVGTASVSMGNVVFDITPITQFANFDTLADLSPGDWIVIDGEFNATGGFDALEIGREDTEPLVRMESRVQSVGPAGIAILGVSVYVNSTTTYFDEATGTWTDFSAVEAGMAVEVRIETEAMFPAVTQMKLNIPTEPEPEPEPENEGEPEDPPPPPPFCS